MVLLNAQDSEILSFLLAGEHPLLELLREQLAIATVSSREYTGVGFWTNIEVPRDAPRLPHVGRLVISDIRADVDGLQHGAGFALFVGDGVLNNLECFIYEDAWPKEARITRLYYLHPLEPGDFSLVETHHRDIAYALKDAN